jgi:hypothetical protein
MRDVAIRIHDIDMEDLLEVLMEVEPLFGRIFAVIDHPQPQPDHGIRIVEIRNRRFDWPEISGQRAGYVFNAKRMAGIEKVIDTVADPFDADRPGDFQDAILRQGGA